ncbi:MFS transporter [Microbacterium sp. SORGH_AS_0862]|uniref:MFS transporter n=1 Tax=Microbacterium sp. SORGH_AS_0862 TaxID=3041789 RepID=UPI0027944AB2|nr:MFS transporter [Microbacterium sp. SORGH_AS_0862]MDQ1203885.1 MFS family permease [Microbacterium sp. SORGH_AS_0862]
MMFSATPAPTPAPRAATDTSSPLPEDAPGVRQPRLFLPLFILAWFGVTFALGTISGASIPKALAYLDDAGKATNLSVIAAIGGVVIIVTTPLFGRLSDRTISRAGMRKPWLVGGTLVAVVGVVILSTTQGVAWTIIGWVTVQTGFSATNMVIHALLADQISARIRARVAAAAGVATGLGLIIGAQVMAMLPNDAQWTWFAIPGLVGALLSLMMIFSFRDIVRTERAPRMRWADVVSTYWLNPLRYRDFFWAWACRFLVTMSITAISTYLLFLILDRLDIPIEDASGVQAMALLIFSVGNIVTAILFGWISDRTGRRKMIVLASSLLSAAGLAIAMIAPDVGVFLLGIGIVGAAQGAYVSVDVALMTEVLPSFAEAGKDLGIVALSYQIPQLLIPILALPLLAAAGGSYDLFFIAAIVLAIAGGLAVIPIRSVR